MFLGSDYMLSSSPSTYTEPPSGATRPDSSGNIQVKRGIDYTLDSGQPLAIPIDDSVVIPDDAEIASKLFIINKARNDSRNMFKSGTLYEDEIGRGLMVEITGNETMALRLTYAQYFIIARLTNGADIELRRGEFTILTGGE